MSDKIKHHHLQRKAILYVRQSSTYQVVHNRESQKLQYAMKDRYGSSVGVTQSRSRQPAGPSSPLPTKPRWQILL